MKRKFKWEKLALAGAILTLGSQAAIADVIWPGKNVTLIVPYTAGGTADAVARRLADGLRTAGTTVIVENKAGAGGSLGAEFVSRAKPDGATLLLTASSPITIFPNLAKTSYDPAKAFLPIASVAVGPGAIVATKTLKVDDIPGLIATAKKNPDQLTFGVPGLGSVAHLGMAGLLEQAGIKMRQIPYRGNSQALTDGLGGVVDLIVTNTDVLLPHVASGALKPLAVTTPTRLAAWPEVPTIAELGYPKGSFYSNYGVYAPAGIAPEVAATIQDRVEKVLATTQFKDFLKNSSLQEGTGSGDAFNKQIQKEIVDSRQVIKDLNIQID